MTPSPKPESGCRIQRQPVIKLPPHTHFTASLLAFVALVLGIVVVEFVIRMSDACWVFTHPVAEEYPGQRLELFQPWLHWGCVAFGLSCGVFVFRLCRRSLAPGTVFHVSFITGFTLLCLSLWLVLISLPLVESSFVREWSIFVLTPLFSAPLTCVILIPIAVLLLAFATAGDTSRKG